MNNKNIAFHAIFELTETYFQISKELENNNIDSFFVISEKNAKKRLLSYGINEEKILDLSITFNELKNIDKIKKITYSDIEKFGPTYPSIIMMCERFYEPRQFDNLYKYFSYMAKELESFFTYNKISWVIAEPTNAPEIISYSVCKKLGIKIGNISPLRHPSGRAAIFGGIDESFIHKIQIHGVETTKEEIINWLNYFREHGEEPIYMKSQKKSKNLINLANSLKKRFPILVKEIIGNYDINYNNTLKQFNLYKKILIAPKIKNKIEIEKQKPFAVYFLHVQPERTVDVISPYNSSQIELIKNIRRALPHNINFFIKEHPSIYGAQDKNFYKELSKIPHVSLINKKQNTIDIIKNAKIVFTISGTVAMESSILKIPSIIFSDVYIKDMPYVYSVKTPEELEKRISIILREEERYSEEDCLAFFTNLIYNSEKSSWDGSGGFKNEDIIKSLSKLITRWANYY